MLPIKQIALCDYSNISESVCIGHTMAYHLDKLRDQAANETLHLDSFFTYRILNILSRKRPRTKLLFWLMLTGESAFLTATTRTGGFVVPDLIKIPGYFESGDQYLHDDARPYMLWNGQNAVRVFMLSETYDPHAYYASDLGTKSPMVGRVEEDTYLRIKDNPVKDWELMAVPRDEDSVVTLDGRKAVLSYAIGSFSRTATT